MSAQAVSQERTLLQSLLSALPWLLIGLALLAFIGYLLVYVNYAWNLFLFPFDYDQGEGFELVDTLLFSRGEWPYRNIDSYPFYSSNYPPLFHLLTVPLVWLFGKFTSWIHSQFGLASEPTVTEPELIRMLGHGEKEGTIEQGERELIERVFAFNDLTVRDVMTPRNQVFECSFTAGLQEP